MLEQAILLNMDLMYYEFKYKNEKTPIKKYYYWDICRKLKQLLERVKVED